MFWKLAFLGNTGSTSCHIAGFRVRDAVGIGRNLILTLISASFIAPCTASPSCLRVRWFSLDALSLPLRATTASFHAFLPPPVSSMLPWRPAGSVRVLLFAVAAPWLVVPNEALGATQCKWAQKWSRSMVLRSHRCRISPSGR